MAEVEWIAWNIAFCPQQGYIIWDAVLLRILDFRNYGVQCRGADLCILIVRIEGIPGVLRSLGRTLEDGSCTADFGRKRLNLAILVNHADDVAGAPHHLRVFPSLVLGEVGSCSRFSDRVKSGCESHETIRRSRSRICLFNILLVAGNSRHCSCHHNHYSCSFHCINQFEVFIS